MEKKYLVKSFGLLTHSLITAVIFSTINCYARISPFQTTRLKSTAGAGVASMLMDESPFLNPASVGFFTESSLYFHKSDGTLTYEAPHDPKEKESDVKAFVVSDAKGGIKGTLAYTDEEILNESRESYSISLAHPAGKTSSMGFSYRYITDQTLEIDDGSTPTKKKYKPTSFGILHAVNPSFTLGIVLQDPLKEVPNETLLLVGAQFLYEGFLALILDAGGDYTKTISESNLYRAGIQFRVLDDIYLRGGTFNDRIHQEKGTGLGVGWVSPRFVVEYAMKNSTFLNDSSIGQLGQKNREHAFSVAYHF